jgi:glycosyltransferase involved in cell wall biosynthesis
MLPRVTRGTYPKIRVLFVIDQLSEIGGAERVLASMINGLPQNRFDCALVTFKSGPQVEELKLTCPVHVFPLRRTYDWNALQVAWRLRRLIRALDIQIVHTFFETADLWAGPIARLAGCQVLISSRRDMGILRSWKHRLGYRFVSRLFDEVHAVSNQVRTYCIQNDRIDPRKIITLYNGVRIEKAKSLPAPDLRAEMAERSSGALICTVANLRRIKGIDVFLRAAAIVSRRISEPLLFAIAGEDMDPGYTAELHGLVRELGLSGRVIFLGKRSDIRAVLSASSVFCLLSRSEGLSNALLEAMAMRLGCVATSVGGNGELIQDGRNGYLVAAEDAEAAAARIVTLLENRDLCGRMGREARLTVETTFTTECMIDKLVSCYESLLNRAANHRLTS